MTNQKISLGEKVGFGIAYLSLAGLAAGALSTLVYGTKPYPTLNREVAIVRERSLLEQDKLLVENPVSLSNYSAFKEEYSTNLELRLQEVRASPEYIADQQKKEDNEKKTGNAITLMYLSLLTFASSMFYLLKKERARRNQEKQTTSGASQ